MSFPTPELLFQSTNREGFESEIKAAFNRKSTRQIMRAYRLSKYGHRNQWRDDGTRYFDHPKALALLLVRLGVRNAAVIIVALLHDIVEDSFILLFEDVQYWFGTTAERSLRMVTKDKKAGMTVEEYFERMADDGPASWLVKLADRLHNLRTLPDSDDPVKHAKCKQKKLNQVDETRRFILPLALKLAKSRRYNKLGIWFHEQLTQWCNIREEEGHAA